MRNTKRGRRWVVVTVIGILTLPLVLAGWEYFTFRKIGAYRADLGPIAAFSDRYSYVVGETIQLFVHGERVIGNLHRLGASRELVMADLDIGARPQNDRLDLRMGFDWEATAQLPTDSLEPGLYALELTSVDQPDSTPFIVPLVLRRHAEEIAVILSTNTWDAYNSVAGISNYENDHFGYLTRRLIAEIEFWGGRFQDITLPVARPNNAISADLAGQLDPFEDYHSRLVRHEWAFIAFLEANGYEYALFTDRDFAFGSEWKDASVLVFPGHSEYWSQEMFFSFERYVADGGKVLMSAGNPMLKPITYHDTYVAFHQATTPPEDINERIGATFTGAGIFTAAAYEVVQPDHWVFSGADLSVGDVFGFDSATVSDPAYLDNSRQSQEGASGFFTLEPGKGSGHFQVLSIGQNPQGPAYMVHRDTPEGGWVFNSSSGAFTGALARDPVVELIVRNLLEDALSPDP